MILCSRTIFFFKPRAQLWAQLWANAFKKCHLPPKIYLTYLDDIWGVWTHSRTKFDSFVQTLNSHHPSIKVEPLISEKEVNFLDTNIFKGPNFLETGKLDSKVYFKPTDTHSLLHRNSFHPKHVFTGILKSQLLRFSRICTQKQDEHVARKELFSALRERGYSRHFLRKAVKAAQAQKPKEVDIKQKIPLIITYSSYGKKAIRTLKNNFEQVLEGTNSFRIIPAYRKNPNLKQLLVRAKVPPTTKGQVLKSKPDTWRNICNKNT